jgi:hypothetical protein
LKSLIKILKKITNYRKSIKFISLLFVFFVVGCTMMDTYSRVAGNHLHLKNNDKELFWFDGIHCSDPNHRMFDDIKNQFDSFEPDVVLVEGGNNKPFTDKENAILGGGEPGYASYLGYQKNIPVLDIEPPMDNQYGFLIDKYEEKDILAMYIIRQMYQLQGEIKDSPKIKIEFYDYFIHFIEKMKEGGFPINEQINPSFINNVLLPHLEIDVDDVNWKEIDVGSIIYFNESKNVIHDIWNDVTNYRDDYSVELIAELYNKYNRIFIMMGGDHIDAQRARLGEIYGSN